MLLKKIKLHSVLSKFIQEKCEENGICVEIDNRIPKENILILKVDNYYNSLKLKYTPASPDCLIIVKCISQGYSLTIVELKDIDSSKRFTIDNMTEKFQTCFDDFISKRFADILFIDYRKIQLFFVSEIELYKGLYNRDAGLRIKILQNKRFTFNGKKYYIEPKMPTPAIKPCY